MVRMPRLVSVLASVLAGLLLASNLAAVESPEVAAFTKAMSGEDYVAKKNAIGALAGKGAGDDNVVLPMLIGALSDRQGGVFALAALRSRTGLSPSPNSDGGAGYPGYPVNDSAGAWSAWASARKTALEQEAKLKKLAEEADKKAKEEAKKAAGEKQEGEGDATAAEGKEGADGAEAAADGPAADAEPPAEAPSDLGRIDRVVFRSGGSMRCYIMSRHNDADGNLVNVRVIHPDGGGEETLAADLIARIDEDVQ